LFVVKGNDNSTTDVIADAAAMKIKIEKAHANSYGTATVVYENKFSDLLEIAACNEGAIRVDVINTKATLRGTLEMSDDGYIQPMEQETYTLTLSSIPADTLVDVYTIDVDVPARTQLQYKPIPTAANAPVPVNVTKSKWLAIPRASLSLLELVMPNGNKIAYLPEEIEQLTSEANEMCYVVSGSVTCGSKDLYIMNVAYATQAIITTTAVVNVYVVEETRI
jgi:hypothetical protein